MLLILVLVVALQAWAWHRFSGRAASGSLTRTGAGIRYLLCALVPLLAYLLAFMGAVGLEGWLGIALISEPMGRATLLIVAFLLGAAGLGSLCFGIRCALISM